jgi:hypothetical protein
MPRIDYCTTPKPTTFIQRPGSTDDLVYEHVVCPHHGPTGVGYAGDGVLYAIVHRDDIATLERCRVPDCVLNRFNQPLGHQMLDEAGHFPGGVSREAWEQMEWERASNGNWIAAKKRRSPRYRRERSR